MQVYSLKISVTGKNDGSCSFYQTDFLSAIYRFSMIPLKLTTAGFTATSNAVSYKGMVTMVTIGNYIDFKVEL